MPCTNSTETGDEGGAHLLLSRFRFKIAITFQGVKHYLYFACTKETQTKAPCSNKKI